MAIIASQDFNDLANFLTRGQFDIDAVVDRKSKLAKNGDRAKGVSYYKTVCANCHAETGTEPAGMPALGQLSHKNPWETIQKIMNGQPDSEMPAMRAFGLGSHGLANLTQDEINDIVAHIRQWSPDTRPLRRTEPFPSEPGARQIATTQAQPARGGE